jgi:hypothetical protein
VPISYEMNVTFVVGLGYMQFFPSFALNDHNASTYYVDCVQLFIELCSNNYLISAIMLLHSGNTLQVHILLCD